MPSWAGDAMAIGCALAWACAILVFRRIKDVDAAALSLFKNFVATVLLLLTLALTGGSIEWSRAPRDWILLSASGVLGLAIADTLFLAGLRRLDASVAAITDCAYAPTVVLLSAVVLGEKLGPGIVLGAPLIVIGLFLVGWQRRAAVRPVAIDRKGVALAIGGVMTTALGVVVAKPALGRSSLIEATTIRLLAGTTVLFVFQLVTGRAKPALSLFVPQKLWKLMIPATLLSTYIAMILWLGGMKYGTASRAALLNQSGAVMLLVVSRFLGETIPKQRWIGAAIAIGGVAAVVAL
ncbi:MAG: DMT family transporter [Polyangiaceae bacterium]|nr:DMT family transporter [Polyangiaceae bacterium]